MILMMVYQALLVTRDLVMVPQSSKIFIVSSGSLIFISGIVDLYYAIIEFFVLNY